MAESGQTDARVAEFITDLRQALAEAGDPARAKQQRAYLKSEMAMYGVGVPDTRRLAQRIAATHSDVWTEAATWEVALRRLWDGAAQRHPLPAPAQGRHGPRSAHQCHRGQSGGPGVLHPQGHRLGPARLRAHGRRLGARLRPGASEAVPTQPTRGPQAPVRPGQRPSTQHGRR